MTQPPNTEPTQEADSSANSDNDESVARRKPLYVDLLRWALIVLLPVLLYPTFVLPAIQQRRSAACQSNLKQVLLGYKQYIRDNDELFPLTTSSGAYTGWADAIQPYVRSLRIYQCPSETNGPMTVATAVGYTDYFYNSKLSGANESTLNYIANTVTVGDHSSCDAACNISGTAELDADATMRHLKGATYAFADGHVKWLKPGVLTDARVTATNYSFQIK